jgi:hypothetical protein
MEAQNKKIKLLYIGGFGRSGSTLLDMVLAKLPGYFPVGEMKWIWLRCFEQNQMTAEGCLFRESPFWNEVVQKTFGGFDKVDLKRIDKLRNETERLRHIPQLANPARRTAEFKEHFKQYSDILERMYGAIQETSGARVIIDSSKHPSYGFALNSVPNLDVYMLHLVRDSRAAAYSWQRQKVRPEIHWQKQYMPRFGIWRSSRNWMSNNIATGMFKNHNPHYLFMRYEDFVKAPQENLNKITAFLGDSSASTDFIKDGTFEPTPIKSIAGNPVRFEKKEIVIRPDAEWQSKMPKAQQLMVTAITAPLLLRYGYPLL